MITRAESILHLCAAAAISTAMLGVGMGAVGLGRGRARPRGAWLIGGIVGVAITAVIANTELNFDAAGTLLPAAFGVFVGLVLAVPLVLVGLRGRYAGAHPHCGRCAFDLTGRPADAAAICPECGAALDASGAITTGVRRRRPVPLAAGAFLAIVSLALGTVVVRQAIAQAGGLSLQALRRTSSLLGDLSNGRPGARVEAAVELDRRLRGGELVDGDAEAFVRAAVAGPPQVATIGQSAAVVAWSRGQLAEATMRGVLRDLASTATLTLAPESSETRVPFDVTLTGLTTLRAAATNRVAIEVRDRVDTIGDATLPPSAIVGAATAADAWPMGLGAPTAFGRLYRLDARPLPEGPAKVSVRATVRVTYGAPGRAMLTETVAVDASGTTTIVPGLARPLPSLGPPIPSLVVEANTGRTGGGRSMLMIVLRRLDGRGPGPAFVGDLVLREAAGAERVLGDVLFDRGWGTVEFTDRLPDGDFAFVLRPRPERGIELLQPVATYQHEVVFGSDILRLGRRPASRAASRPTTRP